MTSNVTIRNAGSLVLWGLGIVLFYRVLESAAAALLMFGMAIFLAVLVDGPIRYIDRRWLSRGASVFIIVVGVLSVATIGIVLSIKPVLRQIDDITEHAPAYATAIEQRIQGITGRYPSIEARWENGDIGRWLSNTGNKIASSLGRVSVGAVGALFAALIVFVTALYIVADPKPLLRGVVSAAPERYQRVTLRIIIRVAQQIQMWGRATLWLMLIVGVACGVGLAAIGVRFALLFGILAGIGEAIPTIGPILTAIPPALVAFADDPIKAVWVLALFLVVQQLEQHLLVPRIMAAVLKLHPVSVLFFVVALGSMLGPLGILLATPACAAVKVAYREIKADAVRRAKLDQPGLEGKR
ncbi:MAG: AI-2E family transporter [Chthonomonadales bacterium]|nr:AI-2E family transporter [Chthonomonadales bacterium]